MRRKSIGGPRLDRPRGRAIPGNANSLSSPGRDRDDRARSRVPKNDVQRLRIGERNVFPEQNVGVEIVQAERFAVLERGDRVRPKETPGELEVWRGEPARADAPGRTAGAGGAL